MRFNPLKTLNLILSLSKDGCGPWFDRLAMRLKALKSFGLTLSLSKGELVAYGLTARQTATGSGFDKLTIRIKLLKISGFLSSPFGFARVHDRGRRRRFRAEWKAPNSFRIAGRL